MRHHPPRRRPPAGLATLVALAVLALPAAARADDPGFYSRQRGVVVLGSVDVTPVGDALLGHLGGQWSTIETRAGNEWLLQWDGLVTLTGGLLGQTHPYTPMLGVRAQGYFEGGWRLEPARAWSLYLGARLSLKGVVMPPWGTSLDSLNTVNNVAGVGGAGLGGALRLAAGTSWISGRSALRAAVFLGESGRLPQTNLPAAAFTDLGVLVRYDLAASWMLSGEGRWGTTVAVPHAALDFHDQTTHLGFTLDLRKIFGNGMWLALRLSDDLVSDYLTYAKSGATYHTTNSADLGAVVLYGIGLGPQS